MGSLHIDRKLFQPRVLGVEVKPGPAPGAGWVISFTIKFNATYLDKSLNGNNAFTGAMLAFSSTALVYGQELLVAQKSGGSNTQYQFGLNFSNEADFRFGPVLVAGQVYQVDVKEEENTTTVRIDGTEYVHDTTGIFTPEEKAWATLRFGHWDGPTDQNGQKDMDNISIGSGTTYGATDIMALYGFDAAIVPPFDSETDPDNRLTIVSAMLHWAGAASSVDDAYASKAIA